jgi:WD40 repeat protein
LNILKERISFKFLNALMIRQILSFLFLLVLAACSAPSTVMPVHPTQIEKPAPIQSENSAPTALPAQPGTLAEGILAGLWKGTGKGHFLAPIDPANGQALSDYEPISLGQSYSYAFSPDRRTLAAVGYVSSQHPNGGSLHLVDVETWEDHVQELRLDAYVNAMDFSPDGDYLAIAYGNNESRILVLNVSEPAVKSKTAALQTSVDFLVNKMKFTTDGTGLMVYGFRTKNPATVYQMNTEPPIVALLASTDLSVRWQDDLQGIQHGIVPKDDNSDATVDLFQPGQAMYLYPGLTFAPNRDILYVVHPSEDKLTSVDFDTQKVSSVEIRSRLSWFERLLSLGAGVAHAKVAEGTTKHAVISPDGQFLYIVGERNELAGSKNDEWQVNNIPLGLQIILTEDGTRIARYDTEASDVNISYDGKYLFLQGWNQPDGSAWTQIFDTKTNQLVTRVKDNTWLVPTRRLNGAPILASSVYINGEDQQHYTIVNPEDLSVLVEWSSTDYLVWLKAP